MRKVIQLAAFVLLVPILSAGTFIVDVNNGAGTQFIQICAAMESPQVQSGDVLVVRAGQYDPFVTSKSVSIRGMGATPNSVMIGSNCCPASPLSEYVNPARRIRLENVSFRGGLRIQSTDEAVHVVNCGMRKLFLMDVGDIRLERLGDLMFSDGRVTIGSGTHAEFVRCEIGSLLASKSNFGGDALAGVEVQAGGFARFALCEIYGVAGVESGVALIPPGDGVPAVLVRTGSEVHLIGGINNVIKGGDVGYGVFSNGWPAPGLLVEPGAEVRLSGYQVSGGSNSAPISAAPGTLTTVQGALDPALETLGEVIAGNGIQLLSTGEPGAFVFYFVGLDPILSELPGVIGTLATPADFNLGLRMLNASGNFGFNLTLPNELPVGTLVMSQAIAFYSDNTVRLTNSVNLLF